MNEVLDLSIRRETPRFNAYIKDILANGLDRSTLDISDKMLAILGYLADTPLTRPVIAELCITSDGMVLARRDGDCGANDFIGRRSDLIRNINGCCAAIGVSEEETRAVIANVNAPFLSQMLEGFRQ